MVLFLSVLLTLSGLLVLREMDIDVFPDLTAPTVTVITEAHGLEAVEVERLVTYHVETTLNGSPNVRRIRSNSKAGVSIVWVEFDWGTDIYLARQIVAERLPMIRGLLPEEVNELILAPVSSIMGEIMLVGLSSDTLPPMEVRTLADWEVVPQLKSVQGVAQVIAIGGEFKQYQVLASPQKMKHYQVSLEELVQAVKQSNHTASGGVINEFGNQYFIKLEGRSYKIEDIENSTLKNDGTASLRIKDVAKVLVGSADKIGDAAINTSPAVILIIFKQPHINTLNLTNAIDDRIKQLLTTLPPQLTIDQHIFRQSDFIQSAISNLEKTLMEGAFFVSIVLFIFLFNWRTTVISLVAIPLSLLSSVIALHYLGYTINTMSLGGMAIAIGALVDDAIIDVENVFKRLRENHALEKSKRKPVIQIVLNASLEIRSSIIIATLIIIVSFVPLFFLSGIEGRLLQPLGIAFITSLLASLFVAITITPVLCSFMLSSSKVLDNKHQGSFLERKLRVLYQAILPYFLKKPGLWVITAVVLLIVSVALLLGLGRSFLPEFNEGSVVVNVMANPGISLEQSNSLGNRAEEILLSFPEINIVSRRTGRAESNEHAQGVYSSELDAPFTLGQTDKETLFNRIRQKLSVIPGVNVSLGQPIAHRIDHMLSGTRANIAIKVFGTDLYKLYSLGKNIKSVIEPVPGLVDVVVEQQIEVPQLRITPNPIMLNKYGMTKGFLSEFVETAFQGITVSQIYEGQRSFDLVVRYDPNFRKSMEDIKYAWLDTPGGQKIQLYQIADIKSLSTPNAISRENVQRKIVVSGNVSGRDLRGVVEDIKTAINENIELPVGYRIEYGGQFESEARASQLLLITAVLALLVIYLFLYYEFKDLKLAAIVLLNLPLALIGGILIVYFTSGIISIASTIGFISLFGIATRNGILLVSRFTSMDDPEMSLKDRIIHSAEDRLIPILMTALTTALALIPIVLAGSESGNEIQAPMALVILGGLLSATFLNLVVIPCVLIISTPGIKKSEYVQV